MILGKEEINTLLIECSKDPELYNKVATSLWKTNKLADATTTLLCTYAIMQLKNKANNPHNAVIK